MSYLKKTRTAAYITLGVVATGFLVSAPDDADAQGARRRAAVVINLQTPLGLQGTRGAGDNVIIPFSLRDRTRSKTNVEVEYGVDRNNDGVIYPGDSEVDPAQRTGQDSEYLPAGEDRLDPRDTRKNRRPQLFSTAARIGAAHAYAWRTSGDIESGSFPTSQFQFTPDGRFIDDPNNPGSFLFAPTQPGVKIRVRAVRGKRRTRRVGAWAYTDAFALNNNTPPALSVDEVVIPDPLANPPVLPNEIIQIKWSAFDDNTEDLNGNGIFDELDGEDLNGNNQLDAELIAASFDYYELKPGETPQTMTLEELAALDWKPCTNAAPEANPDAIRDSGGAIIFDGYPSAPVGVVGVGNQHVFLWNSVRDTGTINGEFIVRARPFDEKREHGLYDYAPTPFTVDNWKIFNSADSDPTGDPGSSDLAGARIGHTVTSLVTVLSPPNVGGRTDPAVAAPKLAFLVAGGSPTVANAVGTTEAVLYRAGTTEAPTTTASRDSRPIALSTARAYHTATLLDDGRVLFAGGVNQSGTPTNTTEIYDPLNHDITPGPNMTTARAKHAAVRLASGDVAIFGGTTVGGGVLSSVEIFRFAPFGELASFELLTNPGQTMDVAQHSLHALLLPDQHVLVTGGIDAAGNAVQVAELLNPLNDSDFDDLSDPTTKDPVFVPAGSMGAPRPGGRATLLASGHVLFSGGSGLSSLEVFNHELRHFEPVDIAMEDGPRAEHVAVRMGDDSVLLAGGITSQSGGTIVGAADLFQLGAYTPGAPSNPVGTWTGTSLRINGDMITPRRLAAASALINGKVLIAGGEDGATTLATLETFTPEGAINRVPTASVALQSAQQSWAFGAPIQYRIVDPEGNRASVVVQYSSDAQVHWTQASPQATTIGGDVAELTANLISAAVDDGTAIDPIGKVEDHLYIWGMSQDIDRPPPGDVAEGFNVRVIPFGAVQGNLDVSEPVTVLANTKVIPTIYPLADRFGVDDPDRGGDIEVWVHLRDIDGTGFPAPRAGETVERVVFEYAVDEFSAPAAPGGDPVPGPDGQIRAEDGEFWTPMTPAGAGSAAIRAITGEKDPSDVPLPPGKLDGKNVLENLQSYSEAPGDTFDDHPLLVPGGRPAADGWASFNWDAVFDLAASATTNTNVWVRVIPFDADEGFTAVLRNEPGVDKFNYVRDQDAIWLDTFTPKGGNPATVKPNEAIDLLFNALVHPDSVGNDTLLATYNGAEILGEYTIVQDPTPSLSYPAGTSLITFWPLAQSTVDDTPVYPIAADPSVQQDGMTIEIEIPGYLAGDEPDAAPTVPTLLPDNGAYDDGTLAFNGSETSTYLLVQNVPVTVSYDVVAGNYDDGVPGTIGSSTPVDGGTISDPSPTTPISLTIDKAVDQSTVKSPNIKVFVDSGGGVDSVIPGTWTVTNEQVLSGDKTTLVTNSTLTFTPFIQYPSDVTIKILANAGLLTEAGNPIQNGGFSPSADGFATTYTIDPYTQVADNIAEDFSTKDFEDDTVADRSNWGDDACAPGSLTGLQIAPLGGGLSPLTVASGQVVTITTSPKEYSSVTVDKGGTLRIRVGSGPAVIRATDITINGTVDLAGEDGWSGAHGRTNTTGNTAGPTASHTTALRAGGAGHSGGGSGGAARNGTSSSRNRAGDAGSGSGFGGGGQVRSSGYQYGGAGGGGAGYGNTGFAGTQNWWASFSGGGAGGLAGPSYGSADFNGGLSVLGGSGGGGGGTTKSGSNTFQGGGGGAGGGAVTLECTGDFELAPTGYIDGRGGDGGGKSAYGGSGGAGSGGGVMIRAGKKAVLDGIIDLRGGVGGPPGAGYYADSYTGGSAGTYGTMRRGGDGGGGRLAVFAPNLLGADDVRVKGQFITREIASVPASQGSQVTTPAVFRTTSIGGDYAPTGSTLRIASLDVPAGRTVNLVPGATSTPFTIYVDGAININGTLTLNGRQPTYGYDTSDQYSPHYDGRGGSNFRPPAGVRNGFGPSVLGSGAGGAGLDNTGYDRFEGKDAAGASGGKHRLNLSKVMKGGTNNWMNMLTGDAGGGGGGNATPGDDGWAPYAAAARYVYFGAIDDSTNKGVSPAIRLGLTGTNLVEDNSKKHGGPGGDAKDINIDSLSLSNFGTLAGEGGGGGNSGGLNSWSSQPTYRYYGYAGHGGSGAGALALVGQSTVNITGTIEAIGGPGNPPGNTFKPTSSNFSWSMYAHSGGGAGSGGFVYVIGDDVNITPATSPFNGATIDLHGGIGGGFRSTRGGTTAMRYPTYASFGGFGGHGGFGRMVIDYAGELNGGTPLFNRYGWEESSGGDTTRQIYEALGGTAASGCLFAGGPQFRSKWYDLQSVSPTVTAMNLSGIQGTSPFIRGQGAQSHPHDPGAGIGAPDPNNVSVETDMATNILAGWRWFRFRGTLQRPSAASAVPRVGEVDIVFDRDALPAP